jgi:Protein of unknown function (DUF2917)
MQHASPQFDCSQLSGDHAAARETHAPRMVIHLSLVPQQTVSWRVVSDCEVRAHGSRVWLTRIFSPHDYWMQAGDVIRIARGERIWLSADGDRPVEVTLTSEYVGRRRLLRRRSLRWLDGLRIFFCG